MNKAAPFFIKLNAFLAVQLILEWLPADKELPEPLLTLAWDTLTDLAGYARPVEKWTGR